MQVSILCTYSYLVVDDRLAALVGMYVARQDKVHLVAHQQGLVGLMETPNLLEVTCMSAAAAAAAAAACFVQL
jgi:hypothetical protein